MSLNDRDMDAGTGQDAGKEAADAAPGQLVPQTDEDLATDTVLTPGTTATGAGTTEADVSDGREQKQRPHGESPAATS